MGFGRTATTTTLGQPLNFTAAILLDPSESLVRECVFAEVYTGDARVPSPAVRVSLEAAADGLGRIVRVTTTTLIDEPVVTVEVVVGCNSFISRRFVSFVDPPLVNLAEAPATAVPPQRGESQVAPLLDIVEAANAARRRGPAASSVAGDGTSATSQLRSAARRPPRAARQDGAEVATRSSATPLSRTPRSERTAGRGGGAGVAAAPNRGAPRLQLEPPPREAAPRIAAAPEAVMPSFPMASPPVVASAASASASAPFAAVEQVASQPASDVASEALARERERIQTLEAGMARLASDAAATQKSLATLQARLREAEDSRYANKLVYALAAGLAFFALLAAFLWAVRPRQRQKARWFDAAANQQARSKRNAPAPNSPPPAAAPPPPTTTRPATIAAITASPSTIGGLDVTTVLGPEVMLPAAALALPGAVGAPTPPVSKRSALTMEELIDLEQQAEFFVVLGQDEAAIELLGAHIREGGGVSPLPYLKLLEIHQRRADPPAYEQIRESFKERFGAFAPEWGSDIHFGRTLEQYPQTIARLQALWPTPMHAMQTLDSLLFRRNESDEAFDFPAYRELLFLYSVARELAGNVETDFGPIDLFLPLDESTAEAATAPLPGDTRSIDLDVSREPGDPPIESLVIRRSPGRHGAG